MSNRTRSTWAADKKAGNPPAVPGYGTEDQDHPAHQAEPDYAKYKKGDPDAWAETPNPPPYPEGNPPSVPGYDTEDQDHPAHKRPPRVDKLAAAVEKRAEKVLVIASKMLGAGATKEAIELQALDMMDWDDARIEATLDRMGGGFLSSFDDMDDDGLPMDEPMACGDMADDDFDFDDMEMEGPMAMLASALKTIASEVKAIKANQNAYPGPTQGGPAKTEEQIRAEAAATAKGEVHASVFDGMDLDRDGFVLASEFKGSKAVFAAIDVDADGIISKAEYVAAFKQADDDEDEDDEDEGGEMASKKADDAMLDLMASLSDDEIEMLRAASDDSDEDDEGEDEEVASKKAADRLAQLRGAKELPPEFKENMEKAKAKSKDSEDDDKEDKKPDFLKDKKGSDDEDADDEDEGEGKEAASEHDAGFFSAGGDPMGLGGDPSTGLNMTAEDEEVLNSIFAADLPTTASALPGDAVEAAMNPQPKQASTGSTAPVGNMTRTASDSLSDLSNLWESAPDVSKVFS
jgi:hypothetical protein